TASRAIAAAGCSTRIRSAFRSCSKACASTATSSGRCTGSRRRCSCGSSKRVRRSPNGIASGARLPEESKSGTTTTGGGGDMSADPRETLAGSPMSRLQIMAVGVTIGLNALDGFDVLSISFASPGIAAEWGIDQAELGFVLSMELIGMSLGSLLLGGVADKLGRRATMLGCLVLMTVGMLAVTTTRGIVDLSLWRIVTGLGIGGMLAATAAAAAEFSNARRRDLCVSLMAIGYPIGAVLGGSIAARLLAAYDWRSVFYFGAAATAVFIPLVLAFVPESVHWLARKQPARALDRINRTLARMGRAAVGALPPASADERRRSVMDIFAPGLLRTTVIVAAAYFFHIMTFYFVLKWVPKIVVDMGFAASSAAGVLVWANVGGALGGAVLGVLTQRFN